MKFIIFHDLPTKASAFGYHTSMKMAHLLNVNVACLGINRQIYYWVEDFASHDFDYKLNFFLEVDDPEIITPTYIEAIKACKTFSKSKNKSSKQIVAYKKIQRELGSFFEMYVQNQYERVERAFNLNILKGLIDGVDFYFYKTDTCDLVKKGEKEIPVTDVLQLLLPDPERGQPLFFLHTENSDHKHCSEFEIHPADSKTAENPDSFYGEEGFTFPMLIDLSANETYLARHQLAEPTKEFRQQLESWAEICYENPNTNAGLDFFREKIQPLLKVSENLAMKSQILKNASDYTNQNNQTNIIFGEAPIEKIWKIYYDLKTITEETFNELLEIKVAQYPKFEGRWPVAFLKSLRNPADIETIADIETVQSVRKVISVD